ncbi:MAG: hypothetical protein JWO05_2613 [Gemmatimonadetes bacterium]|nr:hypothetical protein [Gemmatimonadota bacterium]
MRASRLYLVALFLPALAGAQQSQAVTTQGGALTGAPASSAMAARMGTASRAEKAPVIDGKMDDAVWATSKPIDAFRMYDPKEDADPRFRTEARIAYDSRNVYVFVRAFDPHPDSIARLLARRDNRTSSDDIKVAIDGYHDKRSGYEFATNPAGVKRDAIIFNDSEEDLSWDGVWDVATRIDSLGWTAEFQIPLNQLRFSNDDDHTFGVMIFREIARYNERLSWPVYKRNTSGFASQFGDVQGIRGVSAPRRLEVAPYTVAQTTNVPRGTKYEQSGKTTMGADIKYGVTSSLTLDATVNPDFGQVEADPSVLNLSAFETFFPEKRPFFLEGQGLFRFDVNCNDGTCSGLFYSRRIGRSPQLSGSYFDDSNQQNSTILGAGKLTGQLGKGVSVGVLDAMTQREVAPGNKTIEPQSNYLVGRVQKDANGGMSGIGFMGTAVSRATDQWSQDYLHRSAYAGGVDFRHRFLQNNYQVTGYYAASQVSGDAKAIALTQRRGTHLYQRPDDGVAYDSTRTSLIGDSWQLAANKLVGKVRWNTGYQRISPGFEINDVGFLSQADNQNQWGWVGINYTKPTKYYRQVFFNINQWSNFTTSGIRTEVGGNVNAHAQLNNNWWLHFGQGGNALVSSYCASCTRGGPALRQSISPWGWAGIEADSRMRVSPNVNYSWGGGDEGRSGNWEVDPGVSVRVSSRFNGGVGLGYSKRHNAGQWYDNFGALGSDTTHYTFANLQQTTLSLTSRLNFTATPTLSFEVYVSPFITSGHYSDWRELRDAGAAKFADRFKPFARAEDQLEDFNFKQFRSNAVMRWEYRPGSSLYVVWAQGRTDFENPGTFSTTRDYRDLFRAHPTNTFLVKGSYWVSM